MDPFNKLSPLHQKVGRLIAKEKEKISADKSIDYSEPPNSIVTYVCVSAVSAGWWQSPSARVHESSGGWWRLRHTWTRPHARETPQLVADLDTSPQPQPSSLLCYFQSLIQYLYVSI